jgi:hypothetical protein
MKCRLLSLTKHRPQSPEIELQLLLSDDDLDLGMREADVRLREPRQPV